MSLRMEATTESPILRSAVVRPTLGRIGLDRPRPLSARRTNAAKSASLAGAQSGAWDVELRNVPHIPPFFHVERSHAVIRDAGATEIAKRIAGCLDERSIVASFDCEKASAVAETPDQVRFCIHLFRADTSGVENGADGGILVEVQRRSGSSPLFRAAAQAILSAAKGLKHTSSLDGVGRCRKCAFQPAESHSQKEEQKQLTLRALGNAKHLLQSDRLDDNLLGMEALRHLTSVETSGQLAAKAAAHSIFATLGPHALKQTIIPLIQNSQLRHALPDFDDAQNQSIVLMRSHALLALANALSILKLSGDIPQIISEDPNLREGLVQLLVTELEEAQQTPHNACYAARSLAILMAASALCASRANKLGLSSLLGELASHRACRHAMLKTELQHMDAFMATFKVQ